MAGENISHKVRLKNTDERRNYLKNTDERRNYFIKWINQNDLMSKKYKMHCTVSNYIVYLLVSASLFTGCASLFPFASFVCISIGLAS